MWWIGIDVGTQNGICFLESRMKIIELASIDFIKYRAEGFLDRCENMFRTHEITTPWVDNVVISIEAIARYAGKANSYGRAIAVGQVRERSKETVHTFQRAGYTVVEVYPVSGWTKWKKDYFNKFFDWDKKSNQDQRDAGCIAERGRQKFLKTHRVT